MMKACGSVYYVGEHVQADSVWKSIKSTTDDAFLSGLCFPSPGDILPHQGDFVVNKMDGYTVCLMVEKNLFRPQTQSPSCAEISRM